MDKFKLEKIKYIKIFKTYITKHISYGQNKRKRYGRKGYQTIESK